MEKRHTPKSLRMGQLKQHVNFHQNIVILMHAETLGYVTQGTLSQGYYHRCYSELLSWSWKKTVPIIRKAQGKQKGVGGKYLFETGF